MSALKVREHSVVRFSMYDQFFDAHFEMVEYCLPCFDEFDSSSHDGEQVTGSAVVEVRHISWCDSCGCRINPRRV